MKKYLIIALVLVMVGVACGKEYWFKLTITKCGYNAEEATPCVKLTSKRFWVDRVEIHDLLRENGADVVACDSGRVLFYVPSGTTEEDFIKFISPKIQKVAEGL